MVAQEHEGDATGLGEGKLDAKGLPEELPCLFCLRSGGAGRRKFRKKKKTGEYKMMIGNWGLELTPLRI